MPRDTKVRIVVDPTGNPGLGAELARRADPPGGVVVVRPVPGVTKPGALAADVLIGLGKHIDALTREKTRHEPWRLARLWLQAERARHVVIVDADRLPAPLWSALGSLTPNATSTIWLVGSAPPSPDQGDAVGKRDSIGATELLEALPRRHRPNPRSQMSKARSQTITSSPSGPAARTYSRLNISKRSTSSTDRPTWRSSPSSAGFIYRSSKAGR